MLGSWAWMDYEGETWRSTPMSLLSSEVAGTERMLEGSF